MLSEAGLEAVAKVIDPDMWSADAENYLDAFERKPHDKGRYWDFVTKHGELAVGVRREAAREKAQAAITAYLASVQGEPVGYVTKEDVQKLRAGNSIVVYVSDRDSLGVPIFTHPADRDGVEAGGWRPMDSAPLEGERVLYLNKRNEIGVCYWSMPVGDEEVGLWWDVMSDQECGPVYWLPRGHLPTPPASALKGDRDGVEAGDWRTMETAPKDGTRILAILHRETCKDMDGIRREAFSEVREIWWHPYQQFGMSLPWHAGDPFDSHDSRIGDCHMGEAVPVLWLPRGHLPTPPASALKGGA